MKCSGRRTCADVPPSELDPVLSCTHTKRCLLKAGVTTLEQLLSLSASDLLRIRGIGQVIAADVLQARERYLSQSRDRMLQIQADGHAAEQNPS